MPEEGGDGDVGTARLTFWDSDSIWFNAVPRMVGGKSYFDLQDGYAYNATTSRPPTSGDSSIFVCPSATLVGTNAGTGAGTTDGPTLDNNQYHTSYGHLRDGTTSDRKTYFSYVPNSQLNNTIRAAIAPATPAPSFNPFGTQTIFVPPATSSNVPAMPKITRIQDASATVLMIEKRLNPAELSAADNSFYDAVTGQTNRLAQRTYSRTVGDWQRFAGRHKVSGGRGGTLLFADGHVEVVSLREAVTPAIAAVANSFGIATGTNSIGRTDRGDWNQQRRIWQLRGPAER